MAAKKNGTKTKTSTGEERYTATGKGITVITPGGAADKTGAKGKAKKRRGGGK